MFLYLCGCRAQKQHIYAQRYFYNIKQIKYFDICENVIRRSAYVYNTVCYSDK